MFKGYLSFNAYKFIHNQMVQNKKKLKDREKKNKNENLKFVYFGILFQAIFPSTPKDLDKINS